jgi:hypothetical protein
VSSEQFQAALTGASMVSVVIGYAVGVWSESNFGTVWKARIRYALRDVRRLLGRGCALPASERLDMIQDNFERINHALSAKEGDGNGE